VTPEQETELLLNIHDLRAGDVVLLRVAYEESATTYSYALLNVGDQWYITGAESKKSRTWTELVQWLKDKNATVVSLRRAATWEEL
jgi:hypothetical protein